MNAMSPGQRRILRRLLLAAILIVVVGLTQGLDAAMTVAFSFRDDGGRRPHVVNILEPPLSEALEGFAAFEVSTRTMPHWTVTIPSTCVTSCPS